MVKPWGGSNLILFNGTWLLSGSRWLSSGSMKSWALPTIYLLRANLQTNDVRLSDTCQLGVPEVASLSTSMLTWPILLWLGDWTWLPAERHSDWRIWARHMPPGRRGVHWAPRHTHVEYPQISDCEVVWAARLDTFKWWLGAFRGYGIQNLGLGWKKGNPLWTCWSLWQLKSKGKQMETRTVCNKSQLSE